LNTLLEKKQKGEAKYFSEALANHHTILSINVKGLTTTPQ